MKTTTIFYQQHSIGKIMPPMSGDDYNKLQSDIKDNGLKQPIIIYNHQVLDGWHRYNVCISSSIDPKYQIYEGSNPVQDVISLNLHRRHLTAGQKACIAVEMLPLIEAEAKEKQKTSTGGRNPQLVGKLPTVKTNIKSREVAAKVAGADGKSVQLAKKLKKEEPEFFEQIKNGSSTIQDGKRLLKKKEHAVKVQTAKANPTKQNNGPFNLILSDPPWEYDFSSTKDRDIENQYPTIGVDEIISHKPNAGDDSVLFLWATAPKLLEAIDVMKAWGFQYRTHAIWDKEIIGCGHWFRGQHELLLVGVKGNPGCPIHSQRISSIFKERRTKHSKKPECLYEWIELAFPDKNKLEMYCRNPRKGWSSWGNEV